MICGMGKFVLVTRERAAKKVALGRLRGKGFPD